LLGYFSVSLFSFPFRYLRFFIPDHITTFCSRKYINNTLNVLKCGGGGQARSTGAIAGKMRYYIQSRDKETSYIK
jgi:hypothetical protein